MSKKLQMQLDASNKEKEMQTKQIFELTQKLETANQTIQKLTLH